MADPSFLIIIGAAKCGTSSLAAALAAHPSLRIGVHKEPRFFTDFATIDWRGPGSDGFRSSIIANEKDYLASFKGEAEARWNIDASTDYLWCPVSPERITRWSRRFRTKILCLTRDPIARIISEYQHTIRDHLQRGSLMKSLLLEDKRIKDNYQPLFYHTLRSRNIKRINNYLEIFAEDMLILDFHSIFNDPLIPEKLRQFLELPTLQFEGHEPENMSYVYMSRSAEYLSKNEWVRRLMRSIIGEDLRASVRQKFDLVNRTIYTPTNEELNYMGEALADEIRLCIESGLINVGGWGMAKRFAPAAARDAQ